MLYELIAVTRVGNLAEVKEIARVSGSVVLQHNGVVRSIKNWGRMLLTRPMNRHLQRHTEGHYFVLRFDAPPQGAKAVRTKLALDPRMVRFSLVRMQDFKLAGKRGKGMEFVGDVRWTRKPVSERGRNAFMGYDGR